MVSQRLKTWEFDKQGIYSRGNEGFWAVISNMNSGLCGTVCLLCLTASFIPSCDFDIQTFYSFSLKHFWGNATEMCFLHVWIIRMCLMWTNIWESSWGYRGKKTYSLCTNGVKLPQGSQPTRLAASSMACWHFHFLLICWVLTLPLIFLSYSMHFSWN